MKKILISSDPNGRFDLLLPKIVQLQNKNKFDFMLIAGKVCPIASSHIFKDILDGKYTFPLKTYFVDDSDMSFVFGGAYPDGSQIVPNFYYLGNLGIKQIEGISIAFMSGCLKNSNNLNKTLRLQISKEETKKLIDECRNKQVEILITNQWAQQYIQIQGTKPIKNQIISELCYQLSPRYHISAGGNKYLRLPPFKGRKGNPTHFMNVCQILDNIPKQKYLVAIQMNFEIQETLTNIADNPFVKNVDWNLVQDQKPEIRIKNSLGVLQIKKNKKQEKVLNKNSFIMFEGFPEQTPNSQITQFLQKWGQIKEIQVFKKLQANKKAGIVRFVNLSDAQICLKDSGKYTMYQSRIKFQIKEQNQKYRLKDCFLCMDNEKFDRSLLVFKGNFCFVSIDKGPVVQHHFQIVPINHVSSTGQLQIQQQQQIAKIKSIYEAGFRKENYTFVCIQRYMNLSSQINHCILHCIPLQLDEQQVMSKFKQVNNANNFGFQQLGVNKTQYKSDDPYYILISINNYKFIKRVDKKDRKFQQGRQIICEIIQKPERLNWRDCQLDTKKISQSVNKVKKILS